MSPAWPVKDSSLAKSFWSWSMPLRRLCSFRVRSSSGHSQKRYVVLMDVRLLDEVIRAEVTLSRRDAMGFRMLIGRELIGAAG